MRDRHTVGKKNGQKWSENGQLLLSFVFTQTIGMRSFLKAKYIEGVFCGEISFKKFGLEGQIVEIFEVCFEMAVFASNCYKNFVASCI